MSEISGVVQSVPFSGTRKYIVKRLKLMADYQCHPIWDMSPGKYRDVDPDELPISEGLKVRVRAWAAKYDETLNIDSPADSGFATEELEEGFNEEGRVIASLLKSELGAECEVILVL